MSAEQPVIGPVSLGDTIRAMGCAKCDGGDLPTLILGIITSRASSSVGFPVVSSRFARVTSPDGPTQSFSAKR